MRRCLGFASSSSSSSFVIVLAFLPIVTHYCEYVLGSTVDVPDDDLFTFEDPQQDLFSNNNIFDLSSSSSSDGTTASQLEENIWASSLQPTGADTYISTTDNSDAITSPPSSTLDNTLLSSANACLTEEPSYLSGDLFVRSADETNVVQTPSDFCFQKPDTQKKPLLTIPNLFDLLQPDDQNNLLFPLDTFPRRPLCSGRNFMHLLCCEREGEPEIESRFAWDCDKCMCNMVFFFFFSNSFVSSNFALIF